jgi:hypothetical protein
MTKNQKIALGCGGLGCLGLIVVVVVGIGLYFYFQRSSFAYNANRSSNYNVNTNRNSNSTSSSNSNSPSVASTSMSDDDQHKLFQAASMTQDTELMHRVWKKLGLWNDDGTATDGYAEFVKDHIVWAFKSGDFIQSVNTPEKARAYVDAHIDD